MNVLFDVADLIEQAIRLRDDDTRKLIRRSVQQAYYSFCEMRSWALLRKTMTLNFSSDTGNGIILPADLIGIDLIMDSDYNQFHGRELGGIHEQEAIFRYAFRPGTVDPLYFARTTLDIDKGSTTLGLSAPLSADYAGDYVILDKQPGMYQLLNPTTIARPYLGEKIQKGSITVRPPGTKFISAWDESTEPYTGTATMFYWAYPPPLFDDAQIIMLPSIEALKLQVIVNNIGLWDNKERKADNYRAALQPAIDDMISKNPAFIPPRTPRDRTGRIIMMGRRR